MRPIPKKLREQIEKSGLNLRCALDGFDFGACFGRIQWHHCFIYGKQINEAWAIVGACEKHHNDLNTKREVRYAFKIESLRRATPEDLKKYPRENWNQIKKAIGYTPENREDPPF